jgi:RNA polymerase sigma factor (sigma-70 family)
LRPLLFREALAIMTDEEFAEVLARAREGDNDAMIRLIREYEPQVLRVARARLGPLLRATCDSADLAQSVHRTLVVRLRRNQFTFNGPADLIRLAVDIVVKKAAKKAKRFNTERKVLELCEKLKSRQDPQRASEATQTVRELLESLEESDRTLLQMYLEGRSTAEIAIQLQCNPDCLRVRRSRLFGHLRNKGLEID